MFLKQNSRLILICILYLVIYNLIFYTPLNISQGEKVYIKVKENLKIEEEYITFETKINSKKVNIFYYYGSNSNVKVKYGEVYKVTIEEILKVENTYKNKSSFNYKQYQKSRKINNTIKVKNPEKVKESKTLLSRLKNLRTSLILRVKKEFPKQSIYINSLIFGESIEDEKIKEEIENIGIIQLFVVSGMHVSFIIMMLETIMFSLKVPKKSTIRILLVILPVYGVLAGGGVSIKRAIEMYYFQSYFILKDKDYNKLHIVLIILLINIILNPYNLINIGFILSYGISIFLIVNQEIFLYQKSNTKIKAYQNFQVIMCMLPIAISLNNKLNIILPYTILIYNKIVKLMIILSLILLVMLILDFKLITSFLVLLYNILIYVFSIFNKINMSMIINLKDFTLLYTLLFYKLYINQLREYYLYKGKNLKKFYILIIFLFILTFNINIVGKVQIIDIGQGDSILIQYPVSNKNILIDTGSQKGEKEIINYLQAKGIKRIDYLILTHNHEDHVGNAKTIIQKFKVKNIIIGENFNNLNQIKEENQRLLKQTNIIEIKGLVKTEIGYFYESNKKYEEENNNSLVYYTILGNKKYLFMGDAEIQVEEELMSKYNLDSVDRIKLGHHGSNTSTSEDFLKATTPEEVYISSGNNNIYNHPSQEVIQRLEADEIKYKDTQDDGEIIKYFMIK